MKDPEKKPKEYKVFNEKLKVTGIIYNAPHLTASSDKGQILFQNLEQKCPESDPDCTAALKIDAEEEPIIAI